MSGESRSSDRAEAEISSAAIVSAEPCDDLMVSNRRSKPAHQMLARFYYAILRMKSSQQGPEEVNTLAKFHGKPSVVAPAARRRSKQQRLAISRSYYPSADQVHLIQVVAGKRRRLTSTVRGLKRAAARAREPLRRWRRRAVRRAGAGCHAQVRPIST
jgi:hypothetical protein